MAILKNAHSLAFIKTEDVDISVFDEVEEAEPQQNHRNDGDLVENVEEETVPEPAVPEPEEPTVEEPMVETAQENEEPEPEHENPPELETAQDEPEDKEPEVDPTEELQDASEAPEESFEPPRRSTCNTRPPEKLDLSTKGQTYGSLRSHSLLWQWNIA